MINRILDFSLQSEIPTYEQIKVQIKTQILNGQLTPDQPLTSMRQLARDLRVSVITATRAYSDLVAEELIYTVQGRGCFVKGDAEMVRRQYLLNIDEALRTAVEKGIAAGLKGSAAASWVPTKPGNPPPQRYWPDWPSPTAGTSASLADTPETLP